jgi:hypothetical protein
MFPFFNRYKRKRIPKTAGITIVSGSPRSGTSMMMSMLEAGGLLPLTDLLRAADEDNPKGYYEFERVKKLDEGDIAWLPEAGGKAVKVISMLLRHLPPGYPYKVLFMRRKIGEILASQQKMLANREKPTNQVSDRELAAMYRQHLEQVEVWLAAQANIVVLYVNYNQVLESPRPQVERINRFLGGTLDEEAMLAVVDKRLYRQRE